MRALGLQGIGVLAEQSRYFSPINTTDLYINKPFQTKPTIVPRLDHVNLQPLLLVSSPSLTLWLGLSELHRVQVNRDILI